MMQSALMRYARATASLTRGNEMLGLRYEVALSESGLLVKIDAYEGSRLDASLIIERRIWPSIVQAVTECLTERRVRAEVENILFGEDDE